MFLFVLFKTSVFKTCLLFLRVFAFYLKILKSFFMSSSCDCAVEKNLKWLGCKVLLLPIKGKKEDKKVDK